MILETKRLKAKEMTQNDFVNLASMLQDDEVMYAYEHQFTDEDVQVWLDRNIDRYRKYGFGLWGISLKESDEFIGNAGLSYQNVEGELVLELGYLLKKKFWKQGYAGEITAEIIRYVFEVLKEKEIYSVIKSDNSASIKIAERNGMNKVKEFYTTYYNGEMLHYLYKLSV
ncbi:GNAT family N-acetyltransferase [Lacrimispora sphenoides]|uniref:Protein N-acetyltransferase, RimJ/RimL family n=1 Tax=Lacrimispora sphenoides JCM 1415 TaxID=1297793 RepID=A0ABY1C7P1_9FIRM|nr:GNAT family N-acetyltransferase [Lacrimispora sphenoides]SET77814.1 Protein N-acetyltransferase, RimJ/RimL family [[Clostridium] sphenoides JCM 1415]SUY51194.1 putative GMP synthase [Lacrimispora sphenoides]